MYISKVEFDAVRLAQAGLYQSGRYAEHQWLWQLFSDSPQRKRDFVYRYMKASHDGGANAPHFLVVSEREPEDRPYLRRLVVKPYDPQLSDGEHLEFSLRCNPVITRTAKDGTRSRVDMVQDARLRLKREGVPEAEIPRRTKLAQDIAPEWLAKHKFGLDVDADSVQVEAYDQFRFVHPEGGKLTLARLDLRGTGTVRDAQVLRHALYKGIGRARGFGFGLLLVRRIGGL